MPRDANGNYTLPAGNPVVSGTTIESTWANNTMADLRQAISDSLDRYGRGGMLAEFRFIDGTDDKPSMSFTSEISTGFYLFGPHDVRVSIVGTDRFRWNDAGAQVWDASVLPSGAWSNVLTENNAGNFALLNEENTFTQSQRLVKTDATLYLFKDSTPTLAGRLAFNTGVADGIDISRYDTVNNWALKITLAELISTYYNNEHVFNDRSGGVNLMRLRNVQPGSTLFDPYLNVQFPIGYKNVPKYVYGGSSAVTYSAMYNGSVVLYNAGTGSSFTCAAPTVDGETVTLMNMSGGPVSIASGAGGILRWMTGSTFTDGSPRTLAVGGVATLHALGAAGQNTWTLWGSGLT